MKQEEIINLRKAQKEFFLSGASRDIRFRKEMLKKFGIALDKWESRICDALWTDLHKSYEEAYITEISIVRAEIKGHLKHMKSWARRRKVCSPLKMFPSSSYIAKEPLGNALIVAPWNYPVQLLLNPLVGAISSGCTAVLKPSPYVPNVSRVIEEMISETFPREYIAVVQGHRDVNTMLLEQRWDVIFCTGSPELGKIVMAAASKYLTPVVLELGGKSPCIISKDANMELAAKRIAWGKTLNSGQTCIAPDYILIDASVKDKFVVAFKNALAELHGEDISKSMHYVHMVSDKAFDRVCRYMKCGKILAGGRYDAASRYIEPTLLDEVALDSPVMKDEIFGPVFPMISIDSANFADVVTDFVVSREKPLAFYYFGNKSDGWKLIGRTSSGGACINDCIMHIANENIPFGGVGNSGMGHYHGKLSFDAFSHQRSVVVTPKCFDLPFRYMPYKLFKYIKFLM